MDFALTWDPQPFHIDEQAAVKGQFGGIIASGFQTQALAFRLFYDLGLISKSNIIGLGVDEARWSAPSILTTACAIFWRFSRLIHLKQNQTVVF